jgi:hypothetical protein
MPDGAREQQKLSSAGSSAKSQWAAWREEVRAAAAEDHERVLKTLADQNRRLEQEYQNPVAFWLGLTVVIILIVAGWFTVDAMRCDMFYATISLSQRHTCH